MSEFEPLEGELPGPVSDEIASLYAPALEALRETIGATTTKRLDLQCPECGHRFRKQTSVPNPRARLDAARFIYEQVEGRAPSKPVEKSAEEERIVVFRNVVLDESERDALLRELAEAVLAGDENAATIAGRVYERLPAS